MRFGSDDHDRFLEFRDDLVARFESTKAGRDKGWVASMVADFKFGYLDGDFSSWTAHDLADILLDLIPRKTMIEPENAGAVVEGFAGLLRFRIGEEAIPSGEGERLAAVVEGLEDELRVAVADTSNWSMGKRLWAHAASEGVEMGNEEQMQEFMERFNQLPFEQREPSSGPQGCQPRRRSLPSCCRP